MPKRVLIKKKQAMYQAVWPRGQVRLESASLARRLDTLESKTIGELWDWRYRGDQIFPILEREMTRRYPGIKFVNYEVFGNTHRGDETKALAYIRDRLREHGCDAVISGVGC